MDHLKTSLICGLLFGIFSVLIMLPLKMEEKKRAMLAAFINRFSIGFLIPLAMIPLSLDSWVKGLGIGILLSLSNAIISRSYFFILAFGALGGLIIGYIAKI